MYLPNITFDGKELALYLCYISCLAYLFYSLVIKPLWIAIAPPNTTSASLSWWKTEWAEILDVWSSLKNAIQEMKFQNQQLQKALKSTMASQRAKTYEAARLRDATSSFLSWWKTEWPEVLTVWSSLKGTIRDLKLQNQQLQKHMDSMLASRRTEAYEAARLQGEVRDLRKQLLNSKAYSQDLEEELVTVKRGMGTLRAQKDIDDKAHEAAMKTLKQESERQAKDLTSRLETSQKEARIAKEEAQKQLSRLGALSRQLNTEERAHRRSQTASKAEHDSLRCEINRLHKAKETIERLNLEKATLECQIGSMPTEIRLLKARRDVLEKENEGLKRERDHFELQLKEERTPIGTEARERISKLEQEIAELQAASNDQISTLTKTMKDLEENACHEVAKLQQEAQESQTKLQEQLDAAISEKNDLLQDQEMPKTLNTQLNQQLEHAQSKLEKADEDKAQLKECIRKKDEELAKLKKARHVRFEDDEIASLKEELNSSKNNMEQLQTEKALMRQQIEELEREKQSIIEQATQTISPLETRVQQLESLLAEAQTAGQSLSTNLDSITEQFNTTSHELQVVQSLIISERAESRQERMQMERKAARGVNEVRFEVETELESKDEEIASLQGQLLAARNMEEDVQALKGHGNADMQRLKQAGEALQNHFERLQKSYDLGKRDYDILAAELATAKTQLAKALDDVQFEASEKERLALVLAEMDAEDTEEDDEEEGMEENEEAIEEDFGDLERWQYMEAKKRHLMGLDDWDKQESNEE